MGSLQNDAMSASGLNRFNAVIRSTPPPIQPAHETFPPSQKVNPDDCEQIPPSTDRQLPGWNH